MAPHLAGRCRCVWSVSVPECGGLVPCPQKTHTRATQEQRNVWGISMGKGGDVDEHLAREPPQWCAHRVGPTLPCMRRRAGRAGLAADPPHAENEPPLGAPSL